MAFSEATRPHWQRGDSEVGLLGYRTGIRVGLSRARSARLAGGVLGLQVPVTATRNINLKFLKCIIAAAHGGGQCQARGPPRPARPDPGECYSDARPFKRRRLGGSEAGGGRAAFKQHASESCSSRGQHRDTEQARRIAAAGPAAGSVLTRGPPSGSGPASRPPWRPSRAAACRLEIGRAHV